MSSTAYKYGRSLKDVLRQARDDGFVVNEKTSPGSSSCRVEVYHPRTTRKIKVKAFKHDEKAPGNLIQYLARTIKEIHQQDRARRAERHGEKKSLAEQLRDVGYTVESSHTPPEPPAEEAKEPDPEEVAATMPKAPTFEERVRGAADALVVWIDEQLRDGVLQFTRSQLNIQTREKYMLPIGGDSTKVLTEAFNRLRECNILSIGTLPAQNSDRMLQAYRLNTFNGTSVFDVYDGTKKLPAPPAPDPKTPMKRSDETKKPEKPAPKPAAATKRTSTRTKSFADTLLNAAAADEALLSQVVDLMIEGERYEELVGIIVKSGDVAEGVRILKRIAELATVER